ncbi:hypothetical protein WR25_21086 [Diploscapter pachys]|uniref:Beta-lactamase-related domain-containing protein n=1 Tax=Diploscapter pachys TaxID=2018661 RepID=A0A2A2KFB9_9BILA|nr:hypothetical protein WR25_21086 [Diploscapter pachys]
MLQLIWAIAAVIKLLFACSVGVLTTAFIGLKIKEKKNRPVYTDGYVHPQFKHVLSAFRDNFKRGFERDGAAFCVYYKGECVVDVWGGYADKESDRPWRRDTLQIMFSTTKAVGAVCIALLVDKGLLRYSDKIVEFWPEYGQNGKENTTVEHILTHTAGLALLDAKIQWEDATDHTRMSKLLEEQPANWEPGTKVGYHALTYGWLLDQLVRRIDPEHRSIGTFFREEIAQPHNLDLYIGLPLSEAWRVSRIRKASIFDRFDEFVYDPSNVDYLFVLKQYLTRGLMLKVTSNPPWLQTLFRVTLNNPEIYTLEQCAGLGIGTARDMARFCQLLIDEKIVSGSTLQLLEQPLVYMQDCISNANTIRGRGISFVEVDLPKIRSRLIGHAGIGGQNIRWDSKNRITYAYLSNGLKVG